VTQLSILNGIYSETLPDIRVSYPKNLVPVPLQQTASAGYLRAAEGITKKGTGPGDDRGGINWNGAHYRVMGSKFVSIDENGVVTEIDDVGNGGYVTLDYSFDYLGITSNEDLFLYNGAVVTQVTDPDLGTVLDHIWVDGYFMTTDGEFLIVTDIADPFSVNPVKYGSSEADPDPIKAIHNEPYALNRYTVEIFDNVGGTGFPFSRVEGAQVQHGSVGTHSCCVFLDTIVFVGGGRNESISVWLVDKGNSQKLATREIDIILSEYSEELLAKILVEARIDKGHESIYIHLPDKTLVYDASASRMLQQQVWYILSSAKTGTGEYRGRSLVYIFGDWWVGDSQSHGVGVLDETRSEHWGEGVEWDFNTTLIYQDGNSAIFHELELMALANSDSESGQYTVSTQYSSDGESYSNPIAITTAIPTGRNKNLTWLAQGSMKNWRIQRFFGTSDSKLSFLRLEARMEALNV